jgi:hypothetical protein
VLAAADDYTVRQAMQADAFRSVPPRNATMIALNIGHEPRDQCQRIVVVRDALKCRKSAVTSFTVRWTSPAASA